MMENIRYTNRDHTRVQFTIGDKTYDVAAGSQEGIELITAGVVAPYIAPVIDPKVARAAALAAIDPLVSQITRYEILGIDAGIAKAKLVAKVAEIDQKYPV